MQSQPRCKSAITHVPAKINDRDKVTTVLWQPQQHAMLVVGISSDRVASERYISKQLCA